MHAFRRLIRDEMDKRQPPWRAADLVRASGLSPQQVSNMLNDDRDYLDAMPKRDTMRAIAWAFRVDEGVVFRAAAAAYGVPLDTSGNQGSSVTDLASDVLVGEIARRLDVAVPTQRPRRQRLVAANEPGKHEKRR